MPPSSNNMSGGVESSSDSATLKHIQSTTHPTLWFREQINSAKYSLNFYDLKFCDHTLRHQYEVYTRTSRFWDARIPTLVLWLIAYVTIACAAPVYFEDHSWHAWVSIYRTVAFSFHLLVFVLPLYLIGPYRFSSWLQKHWQLWFAINTAMMGSHLVITSGAVMESNVFDILNACETHSLESVVGSQVSCVDPAGVAKNFSYASLMNNWELKMFHGDAYIWGTSVVVAVQKLDWEYASLTIMWICLINCIVNAIKLPRVDYGLYFLHEGTHHINFESAGQTSVFVLFHCLASLLGLTLARELCRLRKERFACLVAMGRQHKDDVDDLQRMTAAWQLSWSDVECIEPIARGSSGEVWRGLYRRKWEVAVKMMFDTENVSLDDESEAKFLQRVRHPRLVMFVGCGKRPSGDIFLVLEFCENGPMHTLLEHNDGSLPWTVRLLLLADIVNAMKYLHSLSMIHRDLKCENVMLCMEHHKLRAKVCDFGLSRILRQRQGGSGGSTNAGLGRRKDARIPRQLTDPFAVIREDRNPSIESPTSASMPSTRLLASKRRTASELSDSVVETAVAGTPSHMAPELLGDLLASMAAHEPMWTISIAPNKSPRMRCTPKVDVYAFGIVMWETLELKRAWLRCRPHDLAKKVLRGVRPPVSNAWTRAPPKRYIGLMRKCWHQESRRRPPFAKIEALLRKIIATHDRHDRDIAKGDCNVRGGGGYGDEGNKFTEPDEATYVSLDSTAISVTHMPGTDGKLSSPLLPEGVTSSSSSRRTL